MKNICNALITLRYWRNASRAGALHAEAIDAAWLRAQLLKVRPDLDVLLAVVRRDGIAAVPGYWSAEEVAVGRAEIDRLIKAYPDSVQLFSGGSDKRLFGVEAVSPVLARFHDDPFLKGFGELLGGLKLYNFVTLGARIDAVPTNNGSGDGWHRDAHGFQFKSILYLSDTDDRNGPFEYLPGSHKLWRAGVDTALAGLPAAPASRYDDAQVARLETFGFAPRRFPGKAGTLLLACTCGIHRGCPLETGWRYALTNYFHHPYQLDDAKVASFPALVPGALERVRADLGAISRGALVDA